LKKGLILALMVLITVVAVPSVQAITMDATYYITSDHATGGLGTPPFGTVELSQTDTDPIEVTVTLAAGYSFVTTGAADNMYFKFNGPAATSITFDSADIASNGIDLVGYSGAFNGDGTGTFGFGVSPPGATTVPFPGIHEFSGPLSFDISGGVTIADITVPNALGNIFVADLIAPNGNTGAADVSTPPRVPEPATLLLLGSGLIGLCAVRRNFKK
jgi:hypothetical protein